MRIESYHSTTIYHIGDNSTVTVNYRTNIVRVYDAMMDHTIERQYSDSTIASDFALAAAQLLERGYKLIGGRE